jgi:hypothetical protein
MKRIWQEILYLTKSNAVPNQKKSGGAILKTLVNLKQQLNFEWVPHYILALMLFFLAPNVIAINEAIGQESTEEPFISLKAQNQPLGDVLNKISRDTGYTFKLNDRWKSYPVNASIQNMRLEQGLKRILASLNHAIIYESEKKINILVYGKADSSKTDSNHIQSFPSQIPADQQESAPSVESSPENPDDVEQDDESTEETGAEESTDSEQESVSQSENSDDQNEQKKTAEDASSESSPSQN